MAKKKRIVKYTIEQLDDLIQKEGTGSDWEKATAITKAEIEASVAADADEADIVIGIIPRLNCPNKPKSVLNIRIDKDILDYFRKTGKGYQTRVNAILRSYVKQKEAIQSQVTKK